MTAGLLEIGLNRALCIRKEHLSSCPEACRLLYISDIHLRRSRSERLGQQVLESVHQCRPDSVLLGGDLVDSRSELNRLSDLIGEIGNVAPVLAMGGNHDDHVGIERVKDAVTNGGGQWIHSNTAKIFHGSRVIAVSGPDARVNADGDVRILCAHNPAIWKTARQQSYHLVLAGHLHGCQMVAFEYRDRLFPGAFFYPYCYLSHQNGGSRLVVSRGVSDLVPIRWRCPREVVLCHV